MILVYRVAHCNLSEQFSVNIHAHSRRINLQPSIPVRIGGNIGKRSDFFIIKSNKFAFGIGKKVQIGFQSLKILGKIKSFVYKNIKIFVIYLLIENQSLNRFANIAFITAIIIRKFEI